MRWIAPSEKGTANEVLEKRLWAAADQFRANSALKAGQYSTPVLGLIFLRFAEARFAQRRAQIEKTRASSRRGMSRIDDPKAYHAEGVLYLTSSACFDYLLQRPEGSNVGKAVNETMVEIEKHNPQLGGVLRGTETKRRSHGGGAVGIQAWAGTLLCRRARWRQHRTDSGEILGRRRQRRVFGRGLRSAELA